jgi:hypothetical protein
MRAHSDPKSNNSGHAARDALGCANRQNLAQKSTNSAIPLTANTDTYFDV